MAHARPDDYPAYLNLMLAPKTKQNPTVSKNSTWAQSPPTTDIKEFFQQMQSPQTSQGSLNIIESSTTLGTIEEEEIRHFRNNSPINTVRPIIELEETKRRNVI